MATFRSSHDFLGTYDGHHDGRRARLKIASRQTRADRPIFQITLTDLDRSVTFHGSHTHRNTRPGHAHILKDITLNQVGGTDKKHYQYLLLHTWNTDYLTGIDIWREREFGAFFERMRVSPPAKVTLDTQQIYTDSRDSNRHYFLPSYEIERIKADTPPTERYRVKLAFINTPGEQAIAHLKANLIGHNRTRSTSRDVRITFDKLPDGMPVTNDRFLKGDEFISQEIRLRGAPEASYCADAKATAIRRAGTFSGINFPFLTSASPTQINRCNTIPVEIRFVKPVRSVSLTFAGASVVYTMNAYDGSGKRLGSIQKNAVLNGGTSDITFTSTSSIANISRVTFGRQAAVTAIKEIRYNVSERITESPNTTLSPLPHDVAVHMQYVLPAHHNSGTGVSTWRKFIFHEVRQTQEQEIEAILRLHSLPELDSIYRAMSDQSYLCQLIVHCEAELSAPGFPGHTVKSSHDQKIPFHFPTVIHNYIFPNHQPQGEVALLPHEVLPGQFIYQDTKLRSLFFYTPTSFRLTREEEASPIYKPALQIAFTPINNEDTIDPIDYEVKFTFRAAPYFDSKQRIAALDYIEKRNLAPDNDIISLIPLSPESVRFFLTLPNETGGSKIEEREDAHIVFSEYIVDSLRLSAAAFEEIFHSMRAGIEFLHGTVQFKLPGRTEEHQIPFSGRLDGMVGPVMESFLVGPSEGAEIAYKVRVINAIESALQVRETIIRLVDSQPGANRWASASIDAGTLPLDLQPGERRDIIVKPTQTLHQPTAVLLEPIQVKVNLDFKALWLSVLEKPGWDDITHSVTVTILPGYFDGPHALDKVVVIFNHKEAVVELHKQALRETIELTKPWLPFLLREEIADDYFYRVESWQNGSLLEATYFHNQGDRELEIKPTRNVTTG